MHFYDTLKGGRYRLSAGRGKHTAVRTLAGMLCIGLWLLPSWGSASMRVLYLAPSSLFLFEKVGKAENLVDNPARFNQFTGLIIEQSLDAQATATRPYDPVFQKNTWDDTLDESTQVVCPFPNLFTFNLGYRYQHELAGDESTSTLDATHIADANKSFLREANGAVAAALAPSLAAGYAVFAQHSQNFVDLASDLSTPYAYANNTESTRHALGVVWGHAEVFASFEAEEYLGSYNQVQEADFLISNYALNARYVLGEADKENLTVKASYVNSSFNQRQLDFGRLDYALDFLNNQAGLAGYYYHPEERWEGAVGLEAGYADRYKFDAATYGWQDYQTYHVALPLMLGAKIFSFLHLWAEVDVNYGYATDWGNKKFSVQNSLGLQINAPHVELNVYTFPFAQVSSEPGTQGDQSGFKLGLNAKVTF
jgi:hypothetical protein